MIEVYFASFYTTLPCFMLIKMRFLLLFNLIIQILFNGEEGPKLGIFEELKVFLGAHNHEAQFWNDPKYILQLLEAPAGHM